MLTGFFGYQWYFGLVAYGFLWIGIMYSADASLFPKSFAGPMRITALGAALLSAALVLGWVDYCGWALSPLLRFRALCGLSMVAFLYVALLHIREG